MYNAMKRELFVLLWLVFTLAPMCFGRIGKEDLIEKYLLPGDLKPIHYNLHLITKLDKIVEGNESSFTFDGLVQIFMCTTRNNVSKIVLNSWYKTDIRETTLYRNGFQPTRLKHFRLDSSTQKLIFDLPTSLQMNEYLRLDLNYTSSYTDFTGFVCVDYKKNYKKKWILYTELEPAFARSVFPCFDEPKYKTTYNVSVTIPSSLVSEGYHVLFNAPEAGRERINEDVVFHFEPTNVPMSTYLFAVVVSDFVSTKPRYFNGSYPNVKLGKLKAWGSSEFIQKSDAEDLQSLASALLKIYSKDFNFGYSLSKLDEVFIDYFVGGMESWGLIMYQSSITLSPNNLAAKIMAHEIAHQWFGNTVTVHWWSDIWLKEGFATYFEYFGADKINEEGIDGKLWDLPNRFISDIVQYKGMFHDVPESQNHPLTVEVYDPEEYFHYFDTYEYGKGAAIIRMWRHIAGEQAFQMVLHDYLKKFQHGFATPEGLLERFDEHSNNMVSDLKGMKPSRIFRNWHLKAGVPIVSVKKCTRNPRMYVLSQVYETLKNGGVHLVETKNGIPLRMILDFRGSKKTKVERAEWFIPISYSTSDHYNFNNTGAEVWLKPSENLNLTLSKPVKWIVCNNQEAGYYRVNYNLENWKSLSNTLNSTPEDIHEINRAQIVDDSLEIARSTAFDYLPYSVALDMLLYLRKEKHDLPWMSALNKLQFLKNLMSKDEAHYKLFQSYVLDILTHRIEDAWLKQKDCHSNKMYELDTKIVSLACEMGHSSCTVEARAIIHDSSKSESNICEGFLELAYCAYIRNDDGDGPFWEILWDRYIHSGKPNYKKLLLNGMGCTKNELLLKRIFERALDFEIDITRKERSEMLFAILRGNAENAKILLNFITENLEKVFFAFRKNLFRWSFLVDMAKNLGTDEELSQIERMARELLKSENTDAEGLRNLQKAILIVKTNREWVETRSKSVLEWLVSKY